MLFRSGVYPKIAREVLESQSRPGLGWGKFDEREAARRSLYVFVSRRAIQMRVLYFDRSGFCIWSKRLEAGRFISDWQQVRSREMDWTGLKLMLEGIEPGRVRKRYQHVKISAHGAPAPVAMR